MSTVVDVGAFIALAFFAYGPQLAICLWFGHATARRSGGDLLNWLAIGFLWSLVPFAGVAAMWWLWRRRGQPEQPGDGDAEEARVSE